MEIFGKAAYLQFAQDFGILRVGQIQSEQGIRLAEGDEVAGVS